jgi:hypothetical protein
VESHSVRRVDPSSDPQASDVCLGGPPGALDGLRGKREIGQGDVARTTRPHRGTDESDEV